MRVDKFLWCVRYFKTRSLATKACRGGHVKINGQHVKPSKDVFIGDDISLRKNQIDYQLKVIDLPTSRQGAKWVNLYVMDVSPHENLKKRELLKYDRSKGRKKGTGRPTKKERRDLEEWYEEKMEDWFDDE